MVEPLNVFDEFKKAVEANAILKPEDIVDGVIYAISTPPHVQVAHT